MMREFLLEILSEDIPARMQVQAADDLKRLITDSLVSAGLTFTSAVAHSTPRRLVLVIEGMPESSLERSEERKGPKVGAPDGAIQGFLKSTGLTSIDQAEIRETDKGQTYFAVRKVPGESAETVIGRAIESAINALPWPKSMRWADGRRRWVRPISGILAILDGKPIALTGENDLPVAGATTSGHRFLGPGSFTVKSFSDYERQLAEHHVVLDREKRKWRIQGDAKRLAEAHGLVAVHDEPLLEEVAGLVEWPIVLMGSIDDAFMDLPSEVRRTTMRANQKYFTLEDTKGKPAPRFLIVANMETEDGGTAIVAGNERVLRARLSDARFFYDQDRKTKLADQRPKLAKIAFHAKLGSVLDRVERLETFAVEIAGYVEGAEATMATEAAALCKSDLVSGMVGEFPELQGLMGRYYALDENAPHHVADAIRDHYKPLGPNDACPTEPVSVVLALAEKIDTLVGFFMIGELPTGSKDPFALRRAALGVIRLIVENGLKLPLKEIINAAALRIFSQLIDAPYSKLEASLTETSRAILEAPKNTGADSARTIRNFVESQAGKLTEKQKELVQPISENLDKLLPFFADRLKVVLKERGVRHDLIDAVFALGGEDDLVRLLARVQALQDFLATDDGANLLTAYRRAANILKIEEKRDGVSYDGAPDATLLSLDEERVLAASLEAAGAGVDPLIAAEDFAGAMTKYAALRPVVDAFFDAVTVNTDDSDIRGNRLRLLSRIRSTLNKIADFSRIA
ncbi:MAG: glycine--tRNA ligase subunit beta [Rhodospirillales bacterium]|nr:glycine--tRNA ligase subunit beta [Rhodospirillales bacterium]